MNRLWRDIQRNKNVYFAGAVSMFVLLMVPVVGETIGNLALSIKNKIPFLQTK